MYLDWMGKNRFFVEKMIQFANMYAAVYKKEEHHYPCDGSGQGVIPDVLKIYL